MTGAELADYLRDNGYPERVVRAGKAGLIARWLEFVTEVERGYQSGLEEYRKNLDLRGILDMTDLPDEFVELDRRFEDMLTDRENRIWESSAANPSRDFGYPRNAGSHLLEDLKNEWFST